VGNGICALFKKHCKYQKELCKLKYISNALVEWSASAACVHRQ